MFLVRHVVALASVLLLSCDRPREPEAKVQVTYSEEILEIAKETGMDPGAVAKVRSLSPSELRALTEAYVSESHHQSPSYWRLLPARDLAAPFLIAVFERENPFKPNDESSMLKESPASRALNFLKPGEHDLLKALLLTRLKSGDVSVYKIIARHLTAFGTDDLLPHVKVLFEHKDDFVLSGARSGAWEAIQAVRLEPKFRQYLWEHCVTLLNAEKPTSMLGPVSLLAELDPGAAKALLLSPAILRRDHPLLGDVLSKLNQFQSPPDAAFLNALLEETGSKPDHHTRRIQIAAIFGLIQLAHPSAHDHIERVLAQLEQFGEEMVLSAWTARFQLRKLIPLHDLAHEAFEKAGYEVAGLSPMERGVILMSYLDSEVRNGGFSQWYFNDFGRFGLETQKALEKIGAAKHAEVVAKANRLFGWRGPPSTREKVQQALEAMSEKNAQVMDDLNDAWYELPSWQLQAAAWDWQRQTSGAQ